MSSSSRIHQVTLFPTQLSRLVEQYPERGAVRLTQDGSTVTAFDTKRTVRINASGDILETIEHGDPQPVLKRNITYENPITEKSETEMHYFHLSKADIVKMNMESLNEPAVEGPNGEKLEGLAAKMQRVVNDRDGKEILGIVEELIRRSYGIKEGDKFKRTPEIYEAFAATEAYDQLYYELCTDAVKNAEFMNGVIPRQLLEEAQKVTPAAAATQSSAIAAVEAIHGPIDEPEPAAVATATIPREVTLAEANAMDAEELQAGLRDGSLRLNV